MGAYNTSMPPGKRLPFLMLALLAACAPRVDKWQPTVDTGNDPHIDRLQPDLSACKQLAEKAGEDALTAKTRTKMTTDDGILINGSEFKRAYINCMKERKHPVID